MGNGKPKALVIALVGVGGLFLTLMVAAVALRLFVYQPYRVPGASMVPTIANGEHIWAHSLERTPARGALVVFPFPEHREQLFVKRVVGLEGDVIEVDNQTVFINQWPTPSCDVGMWSYAEDGTAVKHAGMLRVEWLGDATYLVFHDSEAVSFHLASGPYKVPPGKFFVLGDNRENSFDSRQWSGGQGGYVPNGDALGRVHSHDLPALPPGAESLADAFRACLAKKPAQTNPP